MNDAIWDTQAGQSLLAGFPRRRVMDEDALDPMILYLSSDFSGQVTGSVITADDGQTL
jgi:enoyl-[acyl-carrier-protein] reductase (NADH)